MASPCAWFINAGDTKPLAQAAAAQLGPYGLAVKGQQWPDEPQAWLASAIEAAQANAGVIVAILPRELYDDPKVRRGLALFRLSLQTRLQRWVNGFLLFPAPAGGAAAAVAGVDAGAAGAPAAGLAGLPGILDDWQELQGTTWPARLVARAHAPVAAHWPARLALHAHERLGIWLESHPAPAGTTEGALAGVSGNGAVIDFHATGPAGRLPDRTVNEYELRGLRFEAGGLPFEAWALRNSLPPSASYYVRLDGEPDALALGDLPGGEPGDVSLIALR